MPLLEESERAHLGECGSAPTPRDCSEGFFE